MQVYLSPGCLGTPPMQYQAAPSFSLRQSGPSVFRRIMMHIMYAGSVACLNRA